MGATIAGVSDLCDEAIANAKENVVNMKEHVLLLNLAMLYLECWPQLNV